MNLREIDINEQPKREGKDSGQRDAIPAEELTTMKAGKAAEYAPNVNRIPKNVT